MGGFYSLRAILSKIDTFSSRFLFIEMWPGDVCGNLSRSKFFVSLGEGKLIVFGLL